MTETQTVLLILSVVLVGGVLVWKNRRKLPKALGGSGGGVDSDGKPRIK